MNAAIVAIGDEVVFGESVDTNSAWLAAQLAQQGINTLEHRVIADEHAAIAGTLKELAGRVEVIILTGGLGPTVDDLTRHGLGDVVDPGKALVVDDEALGQITEYFARQNRSMPENNQQQALRPPSMRMIPNPHGTAPGLAGRLGKCRIFALPGPPGQMQPMFYDYVVPALPVDPAASSVVTGFVHACGIGESHAATLLGDLMDRSRNPLIGITASKSIITARIRARGPRDRAQQLVEADVQQIQRLWRPYAFGRDDTTLAMAVGQMLRDTNQTLVTAESCTGGWLGKALVDVSGSSDYYAGGYVTYSNEMKSTSLAVPQELIKAHGAVSKQVAEAMASGALANSDADYALAITGTAGPGGGTSAKPVGTVYIALASMENALLNISTRRFLFPGDRTNIRNCSVLAALQMLRFALLCLSGQHPLLWEQVPRAAASVGEKL